MTDKKKARKWGDVEGARSMGDGESVEGYYLGCTRRLFKHGPSSVHHFACDDGARQIIGAVILDNRLNSAQLGAYTRVERLGKSPGFDAIDYDVKQDRDDNVDPGQIIGRELTF